MTDLFSALSNRRAIIDRRAVAERIEDGIRDAGSSDASAQRATIVAILGEALATGKAEAMRRLDQHPTNGRETVHECQLKLPDGQELDLSF